MAMSTNITTKLLALAVTAACVVGCSTSSGSHRGEPRVDEATTTTLYVSSQRPVGPSRTVDHVPSGFRHDAAGARAAAIAFAGVYPTLAIGGFISRDDGVRRIASRRYAPALRQLMSSGASSLTDKLQKEGYGLRDVTMTYTPLTATVTSASSNRVAVSLWCVGVLSFSQVPAATQIWERTDTVLVWERGDWHLDRWDSRPGPTPEIADSAGAGTSPEVAKVQRWPAATSDGTGAVS